MPAETLKETTIRGLRWLAVTRSVGETLAFVAAVLLARLITPAEFGHAAVALIFLPLAGILTNAGTCLRMLDADPPNLDGARETARRTLRDGNRAADVIQRLRALFSAEDIDRSGDSEMRALRSCYASLTRREREVMAGVVSGRLNKQVGGELGISEITVKAHRGQVMRKMKAGSLPELVTMAARLGVACIPFLGMIKSGPTPPLPAATRTRPHSP